MIKRLFNSVFSYLGRPNYIIDNNLSDYFLIKYLSYFIIPFFRGLLFKIRFKSSRGLILVGKSTRILFPSLIETGKSIKIEDNVTINALSQFGIKIGNNVTIKSNTIIECTGVLANLGVGLQIGNQVGISQNCFIQVRGSVKICDNVIMGPNVQIFSENHTFSEFDKPINQQGQTRSGIIIENGVWVGANSILLDGITVGQNSVIGAGSVVTKNVKPYTVVAGNPAKIIKHLK